MRFSRRHNLEFFGLPQQDRDLFYVSGPDTWTVYELPKMLGVTSPVDFSYLIIFQKHRIDLEKSFVGQLF